VSVPVTGATSSVTEVIVAAVGAVVSSVTVKVLVETRTLVARRVGNPRREAVGGAVGQRPGLDVGKGVADVGAGQGV